MKIPKAEKTAAGDWYIRLRLGKESVAVRASSEKTAIRQATMIKAEYLAGKRQPKEPEAHTAPTLAEAIDAYIASKASVLSPSTVRGYRTVQRNYFQSVMQTPIDKIDWQAEVNAMARNYKPKTVKNAFRFCVTVCEESGVAIKKTALPKQAVRERPFLSKDEVKIFVKAIKGHKVEIPALLALHSMRRSELTGLDWKNVDLKRGTMKVSGALVPDENQAFVLKETNKNSASTRTIPIIMPELLEALRAVPEKKGRVVTCHPNSIYKWVNDICEENELPKVGIHGLRHTFVTMAYSAGLSEKATMEIAGYSDFATMRKIYTHLDKSAHAEATKKLQNFFSETENAKLSPNGPQND